MLIGFIWDNHYGAKGFSVYKHSICLFIYILFCFEIISPKFPSLKIKMVICGYEGL